MHHLLTVYLPVYCIFHRIKELEVYATQMMEEDYRRLDQMQQAHAMAERLHKAEQKDHEVTKWVIYLYCF